MRKKKYIMAFTLLIIVVGFMYKYFPTIEVKTGVVQASSNIAHSQKLGVFKAKYKPNIKILNLENHQFEIIEAWDEYVWSYKDMRGNVDTQKESQFCINFQQEWLDSDSIKFSSPDAKNIGFRNHKILLSNSDKDTIRLHVTQGKNLIQVLFVKQ
ncbi:hypothetical protein BKI52_31420 [marine bacterium AO1-C]|nr:hypothetical protein BKI52_31420 [marine bacterium AO1-C]